MAIVNVAKTNTFDIWRQKTNELAQNIGDLDNLQTPVTTDLVQAINSIQDQVNNGPMPQQISERRVLLKAIALN